MFHHWSVVKLSTQEQLRWPAEIPRVLGVPYGCKAIFDEWFIMLLYALQIWLD